MKTRLLNLWEDIRTSFWFIPSLMIISAIGASSFLITLDGMIALDDYRSFALLSKAGVEGARSILSTIAGSMITVAGVTFSITIVALTQASTQFGPRLLRSFMRDTGNQIVLGTFIATFVYCLLVLGSIHPNGNQVFVPFFSVTFAIGLALVDVVILVYFIHHVAISINADRIIAEVNKELFTHVHRLFPETTGRESDHQYDGPGERSTEDGHAGLYDVAAAQNGYLQAVDGDGLLKIAIESDLVLHIQHRAGEFVVASSSLVRAEGAALLNERIGQRIADAFIIGPQRTPEQDPEFAIHQLVEVALRALSPGINDPFTAIACIDHLGSALCSLTSRSFPSRYRYDEAGAIRIIHKPITFEGVINASFDQIRQNGSTSVAVTIRLLEALSTIAACSQNADQAQAIRRQAEMIVRASRKSVTEQNDAEDVQQRYEALLDVLDERGESDATVTLST